MSTPKSLLTDEKLIELYGAGATGEFRHIDGLRAIADAAVAADRARQADGCLQVDRAFLSGMTNFLEASVECYQNSPDEPPDFRTEFDAQLAQLVIELRHILAAQQKGDDHDL